MSTGLYKIFISHYSEEKPIAQAVHDLLEKTYSGFADVFISSDVPPGNDWLSDIRDSLNGSDEILTIFTYQSADRPWINIETGYGIMAQKFVKPILCGGYTKLDLPIIYRQKQAVDSHSESDVESLYNSILARIRKSFPTARPRWNQKDFWRAWDKSISKGEALSPIAPCRMNDRSVVWLMGSHRHLADGHEQQKALQVCQALARASSPIASRLLWEHHVCWSTWLMRASTFSITL